MEVLAAMPYFYNDPITFPERYRRVSFWIMRGVLAIVAGGLAVVFDAQTRILAVNVGVSAPLILQALAQVAPETPGRQN